MQTINLFDQPKNEWGSTRMSKEFFDKFMNEIGTIYMIKLQHIEPYHTPQTIFVGDKGEIRCYGFYWGYGGEGPSGLRWAISKIKRIDYYGEESGDLRSFITKLDMDKNHVINLNIL